MLSNTLVKFNIIFLSCVFDEYQHLSSSFTAICSTVLTRSSLMVSVCCLLLSKYGGFLGQFWANIEITDI